MSRGNGMPPAAASPSSPLPVPASGVRRPSSPPAQRRSRRGFQSGRRAREDDVVCGVHAYALLGYLQIWHCESAGSGGDVLAQRGGTRGTGSSAGQPMGAQPRKRSNPAGATTWHSPVPVSVGNGVGHQDVRWLASGGRGRSTGAMAARVRGSGRHLLAI
jgi:hypothetical protein